MIKWNHHRYSWKTYCRKTFLSQLKSLNFVKTIGQKSTFGIIGSTLLAVVLLSVGRGSEDSRIIFKREGIPDFKNASILGNPNQAILRGEERQFTQTQRSLLETQKELKAEVEKLRSDLQKSIQTQVSKSDSPIPSPSPKIDLENSSKPTPEPSPNQSTAIRLSDPSEEYKGNYGGEYGDSKNSQDHNGPSQDQYPITRSQSVPDFAGGQIGLGVAARSSRSGRSTLSFPVKSTGRVFLRDPGVVLPSGSYVKAKLLTGVEAPEGKSYPALLQLDFAYIIPNHKKLDLEGCFIIAKAQGDLSTERVQMQATKLSCVSKRGGMFEREINGFVADDADSSFAIMGAVNSKQDRVAGTAFLSSIVAGIGKAVQQAQTTQQTTALGGSQSILTGDQTKYIGAGGAAEAATLVTQWYLKQAQNLLPTIHVGSGQDIWVVMQDQVDLPRDYFTQNETGGTSHASIYSHFTKLVD